MPFLALACLVAHPAAAQVNYEISAGTAYVTHSPNASGDIVIASTYNGYPVTSIGSYAFYTSGLTSLTIPDSVIHIGEYAFLAITNLINVTIGNSVTTIERHAFLGCANLSRVTIPDNVTDIGSGTFAYCTSLTNVCPLYPPIFWIRNG